MKLRLHETTAFRTAAAFALVFLVGAAVLLGSVFLITSRVLDSEVDAVILAEEEGLLAEYRSGGSAAVEAELRRRMDSWGRIRALYLLVDPNLKPIAGNLGQWPFQSVPDDPWPEFPVLARHPQGDVEHPVRARLDRLPDGNILLTGTDLSERREFTGRFATATLWAIGLVALLAAAAGAWLSQSMVRRVSAVAEACRQILEGDLSKRLPASAAHDEFDSLARAVNRVLGRLEEQTTVLRTTLDSVAHDLRGPLHRLRSRLEDVERSTAILAPAVSTALTESLRDIERVQRTLGTLLQIARARSAREGLERQDVDLASLASDVGDLFEPPARESGMSLSVTTDRAVIIAGNRQLLAQMLANLVENAVAYGRPGGHIAISVGEEAGRAILRVADDGPGIPAADRRRVLQPFVRLETAGGCDGAGLGLSLVAAVARMHRATLELADNEPGLRVTIGFPTSGPVAN
jgi:signal transduction histidine kinase